MDRWFPALFVAFAAIAYARARSFNCTFIISIFEFDRGGGGVESRHPGPPPPPPPPPPRIRHWIRIVFLNTYTDWKCELREGVLNIIKLGYKVTVTALQSTDSAILFPTTLMEPVNWCENVPFPIPSV